MTIFRTPEGLAAEVIDFKSSAVDPERYDGQLAAYRKAVSAMTGIPPSRVTARLVAVDAYSDSVRRNARGESPVTDLNALVK